MTIQKMFDIN